MNIQSVAAGLKVAPKSEVTHTPGPWKLCVHLAKHDQIPCSCGYRGGIWSGDGESIICEMGGSPEHEGTKITPESTREQQFMDAHLIAASPCLLRELKHLVALMESMERDGSLNIPGLSTLNGARKAIALGEGKDSE